MFFIKESLCSLFFIQCCYIYVYGFSTLGYGPPNTEIITIYDDICVNNAGTEDITEAYRKGNYIYKVNDVLAKFGHYPIADIENYGKCYVLKTFANETVVMDCPGKRMNKDGCFDVISPESEFQNGSDVSTKKVTKVCVEPLNEACVGIITPKKLPLVFNCMKLCPMVNETINELPPRI